MEDTAIPELDLSQYVVAPFRYLGNLGDADPLEHGGLFVYQEHDGRGFAEMLDPPNDSCRSCDDDEDLHHENHLRNHKRYTCWRFDLERLQVVANDQGRIFLIPEDMDPEDPAPHDAWFHKDLRDVAKTCGFEYQEMVDLFCSANPMDRAVAYRALGHYHGMENLDDYPISISRLAAEDRYREELGR